MFLSVLTYLCKNNFFSLLSAGRAVIIVKRKNNLENGQVNQLMLVIFYVALNPLIHSTAERLDAH